MQATADEIARIDLGEVGTLVIKDDGDDDWHINVSAETPDGTTAALSDVLRVRRRQLGDDRFMTELEAIPSPHDSAENDSGRPLTPGPFICDDCSRTWPSKRNQTPHRSDDLCPDCYDGGDGQ